MEKERDERVESLAQQRDWTRLPVDMLRLVFKKLPDFLDFMYFRATCKVQPTILKIVIAEIKK
jgi:hypothetical protein